MLRNTVVKQVLLLVRASLLWSTANAGELSVRVATLGYENVDGDADAEERREKVLRSVETQIVPGKPFSAVCRCGGEIIELRGATALGKQPSLKVSLDYRYSKTPFGGTQVKTSVALKPGDSFDIGGAAGLLSNHLQNTTQVSSYRIVVSLLESDINEQEHSARSGNQRARLVE